MNPTTAWVVARVRDEHYEFASSAFRWSWSRAIWEARLWASAEEAAEWIGERTGFNILRLELLP